jgi:hypothetical protein
MFVYASWICIFDLLDGFLKGVQTIW